MMDVIPAVDLLGGRCVRLTQGDYRRRKVYARDPVRVAEAFAEQGARWLHVVDLDGAKTGRMRNLPLILRLICNVPLRVEVGGGIRDESTARRLLDAGARRVIMGTAALGGEDGLPSWAGRLRRRVWLSVDTRAGQVMVRGWTAGSGQSVKDVLRRAREWPLGGIVLTSIARDGALRGPDLRLARSALRAYGGPAILSGGISSLANIRAVARLRSRHVVGLIVGKALYERRFSLREALGAAEDCTADG
ncbi:MAG: 1-(5-phosphoribosyl)-5-[(5-phosphoribosylamino)methylideneamino] imidazole-4-carboxamide isomerase [Nitrospirae bacterium]|nr:1-(5-phosphoribosyl)-5-[(5-phosphoribosylamino)methylideneamino] imidazole-4-carboxamide isomerase [Nitrospirota bacterium]